MATKQSENGQKKKAPAFSAKIDALCDTGSNIKAFASVCISGRFVVRDIAVMGGQERTLCPDAVPLLSGQTRKHPLLGHLLSAECQ